MWNRIESTLSWIEEQRRAFDYRKLKRYGARDYLLQEQCPNSHLPLMVTRGWVESIGPYALRAVHHSDQDALQRLSNCGVTATHDNELGECKLNLGETFRQHLLRMIRLAIDTSDQFEPDIKRIALLPFSPFGASMTYPEGVDTCASNALRLAALDPKRVRHDLFDPLFQIEELIVTSPMVDSQLVSDQLAIIDRLSPSAGLNIGAQQVLNRNTIHVAREQLGMQ